MTPRGFKAKRAPALALTLALASVQAPGLAAQTAGQPADPDAAPRSAPALVAPGHISPDALDALEVLDDLRQARLDLDGARPIRRLKLDTGFADLHLEDGFLFPTRTPAGHVVEMILIGDARLRLETDDAIESGQLELFTGAPTLDEPFEEAVMLVGADRAARALLDRPKATAPPEVAERAAARYATWRDGPVRGLLDVEAAAALDRLGDPLYVGHFSGSFLGERLGEIVISNQPESTEQLVLGRFQPLELEGRERRRAERRISRLRRSGRFLGLELDDLGSFDVWVSMARPGADGEPSPGFASFEPSHYRLTVDVDTRDDNLEATA
ncbi:MAG: hypothetical protein AAFY88_27620, partial [Acidobacteriota bacterium]